MVKRELPEAEYLKISNYIVDMIRHAGGESVLVPSSRKLAEQFNVAHITARKALDLLKKENYIVTKKGVGTFSNIPAASAVPFRVVGLMVGSGRNLFHDYSGYFVSALAGLRLVKRHCRVREIQLHGIDSADRIESEIRSLHLDAMISVNPPHELNHMLEKFAAEGLPLITVFSSAQVRGYDFGHDAVSRELGRIFAAENRSLCYYIDSKNREFLHAGMKREFQKRHKALTVRCFHSIDSLAAALDRKIPDILYITSDFDSPVLDLLERKGIDFREKCRLVSFTPAVQDPRFAGIVLLPPEEEMTRKIADDLLALMEGRKLPANRNLISLNLKYINLERK